MSIHIQLTDLHRYHYYCTGPTDIRQYLNKITTIIIIPVIIVDWIQQVEPTDMYQVSC